VNSFSRKTLSPLLLALGAALLPYPALASRIYFETDRADFFVGDTVLVSVRIDTEGKDINTVEGTVRLGYEGNEIAIAGINTAGSLFSLWPNKPMPSDDNTSISFVGGSPGGLLATDAVLFNLALKLNEPGPLTLSPRSMGVYLNDGKGTKDKVNVTDFTLRVAPQTEGVPTTDDVASILLQDKTPPAAFEPMIGRDPALFENRSFVSFFTTDAESGIAYYEVQEGNSAFVQAESPYALQDQTLRGPLRVKAVDRAGNEKVVKFKPTAPVSTIVPFDQRAVIWIVGVCLAFFALASLLWKLVSRKT
jgi:hypothetical protein